MKGLILLLAISGAAYADEECTTTTTVRCTGTPIAPAPQLIYNAREVSTANPRLWGTGLALLSASWLAAGVASIDHSDVGGLGFWPVLGAWTVAAGGRANCSDNASRCMSGATTALWVIDGMAQAAGLVTFLVGLSAGPKKIERVPVMVVPGAGGLGLLGHF